MSKNLVDVKVEIVMPNYNSAPYLEETINSIIKQTFKDWKLTIVDANSNIETKKILKKYNSNSNINIIWLKKNKRAGFCRNLAIRNSKSELDALSSKLIQEGIVEIGRKFGGSTCLMMAESTVPVISIDLFDQIIEFGAPKKNPCVNRVKEHINDGRLTLINAKSAEVELTNKYDVLFVDGNHSYKGVVEDIRNYWENLTGYALFHDYWISADPSNKKPGVTRAVSELLLDTECGKVVDHVGEMLVVEKVQEL